MAFSTADVQTTTPLNNITMKVMNDASDFIGHELFPFLNVAKPDGKIYVYSKSNMRIADAVKGRHGVSKEIERELEKVTYTCEPHGLRTRIFDRDVEISDTPIRQHVADGVEEVAEKLRLSYESAVYTKATTTANYATSHSGAVANEWDDYVNGDPIGDVRTGRLQIKSSTGRWPNYMAMASTDWESMRQHPDILERYIYTGGMAAELDTKMVAKVLGLQDIFVANATENTSTEGQAASLSDIWGENAVLFYRNNTLGKKTQDFGRTLVWKKLNTRTYKDEPSRSQWVDTDWDYGFQFMAIDAVSTGDSTAGYLFTGIRS